MENMFPKTTEEENGIAYKEGLRIFGDLAKKYNNENIRDLDIILNSLCAGIVRLAKLRTLPQDYESFCDLVRNIVSKNLKN